MNKDTAYDALNLIEKKNKIDLSDITLLMRLSNHHDSEIRAYVAELLVMANSHEAENILLALADDEDELVRVNACDSLSSFATIDSYKRLLKCINDESLLVEEYAVLSIIDIMNCINIDKKELKHLFLNLIQKGEISLSAVCYKGLYMLGHEEYLDNIIKLINAENYHDRCTVINVLGDIISDENKSLILSILKRLREAETSVAVNSVIDKIIGKYTC